MCVCVCAFSYLKEKSIRHLFDFFLKFKKLQKFHGTVSIFRVCIVQDTHGFACLFGVCV